MKPARELVAGRFAITGDPERFERARAGARRAHRFDGGELPFHEADFWLRGVDTKTGTAVLIEPRGALPEWPWDVDRETHARRFAAAVPAHSALLHAGPGIVYADVPGLPRGTFTCAAAAELALQACEAMAALHAIGVRLLRFDPRNLRVVAGPPPRIQWLVPGVPDLPGAEREPPLFGVSHAKVHKSLRDVQHDVWHLAAFFGSLLSPAALEEIAILSPFMRMAESPSELVPKGLADFARLLLPLTRSPDAAARAAALPAVPVPARPFPWPDWDDQVREGEALLRDVEDQNEAREALPREDGDDEWLAAIAEDERAYVRLPLAAAYHERASRAFALGDATRALGDAERAVALDGIFLTYQVTRAVVLDAVGRGREALHTLAEAIERAPPPGSPRRFGDDAPGDAEHARAHAVRGMIALRIGEHAEAERALRRAMEIHPTGLYAHVLGAARWAAGDFEGAAEAETDSVHLEPRNTRYRWALIGSLRKLGRDARARREAEMILQQEPDVPAHRERFERLFGR